MRERANKYILKKKERNDELKNINIPGENTEYFPFPSQHPDSTQEYSVDSRDIVKKVQLRDTFMNVKTVKQRVLQHQNIP